MTVKIHLTVEVSTEEDNHLREYAALYEMTVPTYAGLVLTYHALGLPLPKPPKPPHIPHTERLRQRITERTAAGETTTQIAVIYGTTVDSIRRTRDGATTKENHA